MKWDDLVVVDKKGDSLEIPVPDKSIINQQNEYNFFPYYVEYKFFYMIYNIVVWVKLTSNG